MGKFFSKTLSKFEEFLLSYSIIIMSILLIVSVISRKVFNSSITFSEEVGQTLLIVVTFMGLSYCAKQARHITMSVVFDLVNYRFKKAFVCIVLFFSALVMIYFTYLGSLYVLKVHSLGRVTPALRIPIYIIYSTVPLGLLLCAIEYIRAFIINVKSKEVYLSSEKTLRADEEKQPAQGICSTDEKSACISREEG